LKDITAAISRRAGRGGCRLRDPSSVDFVDTFSRKGRRGAEKGTRASARPLLSSPDARA